MTCAQPKRPQSRSLRPQTPLDLLSNVPNPVRRREQELKSLSPTAATFCKRGNYAGQAVSAETGPDAPLRQVAANYTGSASSRLKRRGPDSTVMYYFSCPSCNNNDRFYRVESDSGGVDTGLLYFLFGGLLTAILYAGSECRMKVQCAHCGFVFNRPSPSRSPVARAVMAPLYLLALAAIVGVVVEGCVVEGGPDSLKPLPGWSFVEMCRGLVERHPTGVTITCLLGLALLVPVCFITAWVANHRERRRVLQSFEHEPTEFPPQPPPEEPPSKERPTACPTCEYSLTGNTTGVCPECGTRVWDPPIEPPT